MAKAPTAGDARRARVQLAILCAGLAVTWIVLTICLWNDPIFEGKGLSDASPLVRLFLGFHPPKAYMPLRLVTYSLMHTTPMLIGNLILLAVVYAWGRDILGPGAFIRVYSLATVVGGLAYLVISRLTGTSLPYLGAFAPLLGVLGLLTVVKRRRLVNALNKDASTLFGALLLLLLWCLLHTLVPLRHYYPAPKAALGPALGAACAGLLVGVAYGLLDKWWRERSAGRSGALSGVGGVIIILLALAGLAAASLALYKEQEQLAQVVHTLRSGTEQERRQAAAELARTREWSEQVVQGLVVGLDDPAGGIRRLVADALLDLVRRRPAMHAYDGLDDFAALLEHERSDVRILGVRCLATIGDDVAAYTRAIENEDPRVRRFAAEGLAETAIGDGNKRAIRTLIKHCQDEDSTVHNTAVKALEHAARRHEDSWIRFEAVRALAGIKGETIH